MAAAKIKEQDEDTNSFLGDIGKLEKAKEECKVVLSGLCPQRVLWKAPKCMLS